MKYLILTIFLGLLVVSCSSKRKQTMVVIQTNYGDIKVALYDDTPLHKENFIKLVQSGYYKGKTFHRVIHDFMIQAGAADASDTAHYEKTIPAEIHFPQHCHTHGALAAARYDDDRNPERRSSMTQFFIVTGTIQLESELHQYEKERYEKLKHDIYTRIQSENMDTIKALYRDGKKNELPALRAKMAEEADAEASKRKGEILYKTAQVEQYRKFGGVPYLDGEYTVFGEVVDGIEVVEHIQDVKTGAGDVPNKPVVINNMKLVD